MLISHTVVILKEPTITIVVVTSFNESIIHQ